MSTAANPWEKYQSQGQAPWEKYQTAPEATAGPSAGETAVTSMPTSTIGQFGVQHPLMREAALGAFGGLGIPETKTPLRDLAEGAIKTGVGLVANPAETLYGMGKGLMDTVHQVGHGLISGTPEERAHALGTIGGTAAGMALFPEAEKAPITRTVKAIGRAGLKEVMGVSPSMRGMQEGLHESAITKLQPFVQEVAKQVHTDAAQAMSETAAKVDAKSPGGIFDKGEVRSNVKEAVGSIARIPEKMPPAIAKILGALPEDKTPVVISGKKLNLDNPSDLQIYNQYKTAGAITPEEAKRFEGGGDKWTFEQLKQFRSDLGRELQQTKGTVKAASSKVYGQLSDMLQSEAQKANVGEDWGKAVNKYRNYMQDFEESPLAQTTKGANAQDIASPFIGKTSQQVQGILRKYLPSDVLEALTDEANKHKVGQQVERLSRPSKFDLIMAGMSPKGVALRMMAPYMMRRMGMIEGVAGKGLPEGALGKIKVAANAAAK